ncbi:hypothetical protein AAC387_Pa10g0708 [Persea americana]
MDPLLQNDPGVTCWPSLFKTNVSSSRELENCQEPSADPGIHVEFEDEDTSVAKVTWGNALVGYFIGNNPPFFAIKSSLETSATKLKQVWIPKKPPLETQLHANPDEPNKGTADASQGDWNVVKDKKSRSNSPIGILKRPASPKKNASDPPPAKVNRFSSLSNLDGESSASMEELA